MAIGQTQVATEAQTTGAGRLEAIWLKRYRGGPMDPTERAAVIANQGLAGDANHSINPRSKRQVTIIAKEQWAATMAELGRSLDPSARRANLMVSGIELAESRDRILQIGGVRVHIYGETKPCEVMDAASAGLREALRPHWRAGAFGQVLDDGEIAVGDPVRWLD